MRSKQEFAEEALLRADAIRREKARTKRKIHAVIAMAACLVIIVGISFAMPAVVSNFPDNAETAGAYSAALFAGGLAGSYVLLGVIAFSLGVIVTLMCLRYLKKR